MRTHLGVAACWLAASPAWAQDVTSADDEVKALKEVSEEDEDGWDVKLKLGGTFNVTDSRNVVGAEEGTAVSFGLVFEGSANLTAGQHRWRNRLKLQESQSLTPPIDRFVKSFDLLEIETLYIYKLKNPEWLGFFGRATLQTPILDGYLVRPEDVLISVDGGPPTVSRLEAGENSQAIDLTSAFEPLQLRQIAGAYADPVKEPAFNLEGELGVGFQETVTQSGFVLAESTEGPDPDSPDPANPVTLEQLNLTTLEDTAEFGAELELRIFGTLIQEEVLKYTLTSNVFIPIVEFEDTGRDFGDTINFKLNAGLALKLTDYLSAEYTLNLIRQPQITTDLQVQNAFVLALTVDVI